MQVNLKYSDGLPWNSNRNLSSSQGLQDPTWFVLQSLQLHLNHFFFLFAYSLDSSYSRFFHFWENKKVVHTSKLFYMLFPLPEKNVSSDCLVSWLFSSTQVSSPLLSPENQCLSHNPCLPPTHLYSALFSLEHLLISDIILLPWFTTLTLILSRL